MLGSFSFRQDRCNENDLQRVVQHFHNDQLRENCRVSEMGLKVVSEVWTHPGIYKRSDSTVREENQLGQ